jgi:lipoprotein-releasing system permease protein
LNFPLYIAKRYLISKSSNNAINIIAYFAFGGVVIATVALFVVLSGFAGLKKFSMNFYQAADPDLKISPLTGKTFHFSDSITEVLQNEDIASYSKVLQERALFKYNGKEVIADLYGVDEQFTKVTPLDTMLTAGNWLNSEALYGAVSGITLAHKIGLRVDYLNPLEVYIPKPGNRYDITNPGNMVNSLELRNVGVFALMEEWDGRFVFVNLPVAQELLRYDLNQISAINIKLLPEIDSEKAARSIQKRIGSAFKVQTRAQLNAVFYRMLKTENLVLYFVLVLFLVIALFNIIGTIIMMILDKKENLKTLHNMGVSVPELQKIFVYQGFLLSIAGMVIGIVLGMTLVWVQKKWHIVKINEHLPFPMELTVENIVLVIISILVLSYLASLIAGKRISSRLFQ